MKQIYGDALRKQLGCFFILYNDHMYSSKYSNKGELITKLKERGVIVDDPSILDKVNYSHLMYKYGKFFLDIEKENNIKYKEGTKISDIYKLYKLNIGISKELFGLFNLFEHQLKSIIVRRIGSNPIGYIDPDFYNVPNDGNYDEINKFILSLELTESKKRIKYDCKYHVEGKLPIWLLIDEMPIGQLRMIIKLKGIKSDVVKEMGINPRKSWLLISFNNFRNQIAHMDIISPKIGKSKLRDILIRIKLNFPNESRIAFKQINELIDDSQFDSEKVKDYLQLS